MTQTINGRSYFEPGALIPGGAKEILYVAIDTSLNIATNFPAADFIHCKARATDLNRDLVSNGTAWVPDAPAQVPGSEVFIISAANVGGNSAEWTAELVLPYNFVITDIKGMIYSGEAVYGNNDPEPPYIGFWCYKTINGDNPSNPVTPANKIHLHQLYANPNQDVPPLRIEGDNNNQTYPRWKTDQTTNVWLEPGDLDLSEVICQAGDVISVEIENAVPSNQTDILFATIQIIGNKS